VVLRQSHHDKAGSVFNKLAFEKRLVVRGDPRVRLVPELLERWVDLLAEGDRLVETYGCRCVLDGKVTWRAIAGSTYSWYGTTAIQFAERFVLSEWVHQPARTQDSWQAQRTSRKNYQTRDDARADVFDYIERFYNLRRRRWATLVRLTTRREWRRTQAEGGVTGTGSSPVAARVHRWCGVQPAAHEPSAAGWWI